MNKYTLEFNEIEFSSLLTSLENYKSSLEKSLDRAKSLVSLMEEIPFIEEELTNIKNIITNIRERK